MIILIIKNDDKFDSSKLMIKIDDQIKFRPRRLTPRATFGWSGPKSPDQQKPANYIKKICKNFQKFWKFYKINCT